MPIRSQVRRDLHRHVDDRLFKWVQDTIALYDMADLGAVDALEDIYMSLFSGMGALAAAYNLDHEPIIETLRKSLEISQRKYDQRESR